MARKRQKKTGANVTDYGLQQRVLVDAEQHGAPEREEFPKVINRNKRGTTSMWRLIARTAKGKKLKLRINYDDIGRQVYGHVLQSYIGYLLRSNLHCVPRDLKEKIWKEISEEKFKKPVESEALKEKGKICKKPVESATLENEEKLKSPSSGALSKDSASDRRAKLKMLPMSCKYVYTYADKMMTDVDNLRIACDEAMFGQEKSTWLSRDDILDFMEMDQIGDVQILIYMGHLFEYLKEENKTFSFSFVDPGCIPGHDDLSRHEQHIIDRLNASSVDSIMLIPYNIGSHWILIIINEDKDMVYLLDSLDNWNQYDAWISVLTSAVKTYNALRGIRIRPSFKHLKGNMNQNPESVECGYCVLRYMREIVEWDYPQWETKFGGLSNACYSQDKYDEVRVGWSEFVFSQFDT